MTKIAIVGIGAVGGYFGGKLAKHYENSDQIEVYFIARGENEKSIKLNGLRVETTRGNFIAYPRKISSDPSSIGVVDILIACTKNYDIEQTILQLKPCITKDSIILPLLNGVEGYDLIKNILPANDVLNGCVYLVSQLVEPGFVRETGKLEQLYFGSSTIQHKKLLELESIFVNANIRAAISPDIQETTWCKFIFISTLATITSYLNTSIGEIISDEISKDQLLTLLTEIKMVAETIQISLPADILKRIVDKLEGLPFDTTSSMYIDFHKGNSTELESLTGYIVRLGKKLNIPTPTYNLMYDELKIRDFQKS
jgi:2-dehydropantoate 2-reductase